jgi:outer membrane lipoprotein-sorting protein
MNHRKLILLLAVLPLTGCLFRSHKVERTVSTVPLKSSSQQDLVEFLNTQAARLKSLQATVDVNASVGGAETGKVTDYQEIRGYILAKKPALLRMIGLMPIVRNRAFDMVSDGRQFELWIPPKNKFFVGHNDVVQPSTHSLENLRPKVIYDALLIQGIDPQNEIAVLEKNFETVTDAKGHRVEQPDYEISVIRREEQGWFLARKVIFSRTDLLPHRQLIYDEEGNIATDATYEGFQSYEGIDFPSQIEILRPREEYSIFLKVLKLQVNGTLTAEQFTLKQPPGAEVVNLDRGSKPRVASDGNGGEPKNR